MSDFYPLIAQAVKGLQKDTPEARGSIYDVARAAMLAQLRSITPALSESDINRQQLALEEAIAKVEIDSSHATILEPDHCSRPIPETRETQSEMNSPGGQSQYLAWPPGLMGEAHKADPRVASAMNSSEKRTTATIGRFTPPRRQKRVGLTILGLLLLAAVGTGLSNGSGIIASLRATLSLEETTGALARGNATSSKFGDRIDYPAIASLTSKIDTPLAQKVILYEEDGADPAGKRFDGTTLWRTETVPPGAGEVPIVALRADIEIPEQRLGVRLALTKNDDAGISGSSVGIAFSLPPDYSHGGVSRIAGVLMKQAESSRGLPLAGVVVKVASNYFLFNLSSAEVDIRHNVELLKEQSWLDIPIIYNDGFRAIIAVEKGESGDRAFSDAFAAWEGVRVPGTQP